MFFACSSDEAIDGSIKEDVDNDNNTLVPIAETDYSQTTQNSSVVIENVLSNDTIYDYGTIVSFDNESENGGTIEILTNNSFRYSPLDGFSGSDQFTYELCDNGEPENCSTGSVIIEVTKLNTVPMLVNDELPIILNSQDITISIFDNDELFDEIENINFELDTSDLLGEIVLNDSDIVYTPPTDFIGVDSFSYTVCDNDEVSDCDTAVVNINVLEELNFNVSLDLSSYYEDIIFYNNEYYLLESLKEATENSHKTKLSYSQRHDYLYDADEDLVNPDNVVLIYSGESRYWEEYQGNSNYSPLTFNTEHVYPQSFLGLEQSKSDLHLLRVCDASINSSRSNSPYGDGSGDYGYFGNDWYPGDEWKGDVARIVLYVNMYYDEPISDVGDIETFLKWNVEDPVSEFELQRNDVIEDAQGNRNPFIDNPYLATLIWGGEPAENTWE